MCNPFVGTFICLSVCRVVFHSTNERSHGTKDNISNPNLNSSILLKNSNINNSILLKRVSYCYCYGIFRSECRALLCVYVWVGGWVRACVRETVCILLHILFKPLGFCVAGLWTLIDQLLL